MTQSSRKTVADADNELVLTRVVNAPRELVWRAWTDPKHLPNWWGPRGFTTRTHALAVRPGGSWRFAMIGPDGREYENLLHFEELVEPERLRYRMGGEPGLEPVNHRVLVTFERTGSSGGQTLVTLKSTFESKAARDFVVREYRADEGGRQHLERLEEYIRDRLAPSRAGFDAPFVITRVVKAPRTLVWDVWTQAEHLSRWFGMKGGTPARGQLDFRVGGSYHYSMGTPDGQTMWGKWLFREIVPPERLVFIVAFSDAKQGLTRHPLSPGWPPQTLSTLTLADHAGIGGGTALVLTWEPFEASASERQEFAAGHASMREGWGGTFAQLDEYLAERQSSGAEGGGPRPR